MMENGFSSPRTDVFPAGLRVLVVDDDLTWLKILEKMLKKCSYEVTTCGLAREALNLLRERKDGFDIVLSDVNMPDMDGFKLLEHVGLEMDLPVIMMSVDGETSRVMKGVQHGACDYLLKPIRMKELRNIWQHVFRKRIHEVRDIENYECIEDIQLLGNGCDQSDDGHLLSMGDSRKRKDIENKHDDKDLGDSSSTKKPRVVWTVDLHQKFVKAVNQIGFDKVGPKKILDLMNVPWLTRENVASHLQKYRLYLSRLQKENDIKVSFSGAKPSDSSPKDHPGSFGIQNSLDMHQSDAVSGKYGYTANRTIIQNADPKIHEGDLKNIFSPPKTEPKKPLIVDIPESQKVGRTWMGLNYSFKSTEADEIYASFDSTIPIQYWLGEVSEIQLKQEHKPHLQLKDDLSLLPQCTSEHTFQVNRLKPSSSVSVSTSIADRDKTGPAESKPSYANCRNKHVRALPPEESAINSFSQSISHIVDCQTLLPISTATLSIKNRDFNQSSISDIEAARSNLFSESGSAVASLGKDLQVHWLQGDYYTTNLALQNMDCLDYNDPEFSTNSPLFLYDALRFECDYPCDSVEYSIIDQRLFA